MDNFVPKYESPNYFQQEFLKFLYRAAKARQFTETQVKLDFG